MIFVCVKTYQIFAKVNRKKMKKLPSDASPQGTNNESSNSNYLCNFGFMPITKLTRKKHSRHITGGVVNSNLKCDHYWKTGLINSQGLIIHQSTSKATSVKWLEEITHSLNETSVLQEILTVPIIPHVSAYHAHQAQVPLQTTQKAIMKVLVMKNL